MHRPALTGVQERKYQYLGPEGEGGGRVGPLASGPWPPPLTHLRNYKFGRKYCIFSTASAHQKPLILRVRTLGVRLHHQGELRITSRHHSSLCAQEV